MDDPQEISSVADDNDDISVTSTIPDDAEADWAVDQVLAEKIVDGELHYLVEFQNRPLSEADWIPKEELLVEDAIAAWEAQKTRQSNGQAQRFRLEEWKTAVTRFVRGKFAKKDARNEKRRRLGMPLIEYEDSLEGVLAHLDRYLADEEADHQTEPVDIRLGATSSYLQSGDLQDDAEMKHTDTPVADQKSTDPRLQAAAEVSGPSHVQNFNIRLAKAAREVSKQLAADALAATALKRKLSPDADTVDAKRLRLVIPVQATHSNPSELGSHQPSVSEAEHCIPDSSSTEGTLSPASYLRRSMSTDDKDIGDTVQSILKSGSHSKTKTKKSVRWLDPPQGLELIQGRTEDSLFVGDVQDEPNPVEQVMDKLEKDSVPLSSPSRLMPKTVGPPSSDIQSPQNANVRSIDCILDTKTLEPFTLAFEGITHHPDPWWLSDLDSLDCLRFTHTCLATDFHHFDTTVILRENRSNLIEGAAFPVTSGNELRRQADLMRVGELGWLSHRGSYCVLVFPSLSEGWKVGGVGESGSSSQHPLRYWIFKPTSALDASLLAPVPFKDGSNQTSLLPGPGKTDSGRPFGPEYQDLIPWGSKKINHQFFLAFPEPRAQEAALISQWLRESNPECSISTSLIPGQWRHFIKQEHGVVLLHEDAISSIRRFPDFHKLLHRPSAQHSFWIFTRSLYPLFSSHAVGNKDLGNIRLTRAFSHGIAMCITPSFLLAQPEQAYELFKWFWHKFFAAKDAYYRGRLVVSAGLDQWLFDLISEKSRFRARSHRMSARELNLKGIHDEGMEARSKTLKLLQQLVIESIDVTDGPLVFAPECLDGNDEQSLVNWFGWWSVLHADQFRKFSVVGSSDLNLDRLGREASEPRYISGTVNDPDTYFGNEQVLEGIVTQEQRSLHPSEAPRPMTSPLSISRILANDKPKTIETYLTRILHRIRENSCPMVLFKKPVSYWNSEMAFHFGDYYSRQYQSYSTFLKFFLPFAQVGHPFAASGSYQHLFTYVGLFYTLEGKWDAGKFPKQGGHVRKPWLAIYRPIDAYRKPWKGTELLLWDAASRGRFSQGDDVYEGDLSEAQCQLIEAVKNDVKNADLPLKQVWLGGIDSQATDPTNALDMTLAQLELFVDDIKDRLPLPESQLPDRGWLAVKPGRAPEAQRLFAEENLEELASMRMIFHAPRRPAMHAAAASKCTNHLYTWSTEAHRRRKYDMSLYRFTPTMTWYSKQVAEKRGFEHINVASWESIFDTYKIRDPKRDRSASASGGSSMG